MLQGLAAAEAVCPQRSIQLPWLIGFAFSCREHPYLQRQKCMDTHWTSEHSHFPHRRCPSATECKGEMFFGIEGGWGLRFLLCSDEDWPALQEVQQQLQFSRSACLQEQERKPFLFFFRHSADRAETGKTPTKWQQVDSFTSSLMERRQVTLAPLWSSCWPVHWKGPEKELCKTQAAFSLSCWPGDT